MPDDEKVKEKAESLASPLTEIANWKYVSPFEEKGASRASLAQKANKGFFDSLQRTANGTAATLGRTAKVIIRDREIIKSNIEAIMQDFKDYEKPFKKNENTERISSLVMEINATNAYWKRLARELDK